ncbi:MAG: hypothetical protein AAGK37_12115 [Pseudomonadota bacterium]
MRIESKTNNTLTLVDAQPDKMMGPTMTGIAAGDSSLVLAW